MSEHKDWAEWHKHYDDSDSDLAKRLAVVQQKIADCLPENPVQKYQIIDICAGDARDLIPVLADYPHKDFISGLLIEIDESLLREAAESSDKAGISGLEFRLGDAALISQYDDAIPTDLIMLCGVFGNISDNDVQHTIQALPGFSKNGTRVLWTRNRRAPDATPRIRQLFIDAGFIEISFDAPDGTVYGIGLYEYRGPDVELDASSKLFTFVR